MKDVVIDLKNMCLEGDVLDISLKGNTIISELILRENEEVEKDFMVLDYKENSGKESAYDSALAFLSLSSVLGRKRYDRVLSEIKRLLKENGKLMIWDIQVDGIKGIGKKNIEVVLKDDWKIDLPFKVKYNPFRLKFMDVIRLLEINKFKISSSIISGGSFYIEAINTKEARDEDFTSSFKRKIYTYKLGNKIPKKLFKGVSNRNI